MKKIIITLCILLNIQSFAISSAFTGNAMTAAGGLFLTVAAFGADSPEVGVSFMIWALVLLDEEAGDLQFTQVDADKLSGVTAEEVAIYNSEIDDVNIIFQEVIGLVEEDMTREQVFSIWEDHSHYLSPETFKVMRSFSNQ